MTFSRHQRQADGVQAVFLVRMMLVWLVLLAMLPNPLGNVAATFASSSFAQQTLDERDGADRHATPAASRQHSFAVVSSDGGSPDDGFGAGAGLLVRYASLLHGDPADAGYPAVATLTSAGSLSIHARAPPLSA